MSDRKKMDPRIKAATDFGPLLIFLVTYYTAGIMWATGAIIAATLVALIVTYALERKIAPMPLVPDKTKSLSNGLPSFGQHWLQLVFHLLRNYISRTTWYTERCHG